MMGTVVEWHDTNLIIDRWGQRLSTTWVLSMQSTEPDILHNVQFTHSY